MKERIKIKHAKSNVIKVFLITIFLLFLIIPLISIFTNVDKKSISEVISSPQFSTALKNSLTVGIISTIITLIISYFLAVCLERSKIKYKEIWSTVFVLPMLIPSISHGMGLILLFGNNGFFTNLFDYNINVYGCKGIVIGSIMYAFPVAFLMFRDVLKYEDQTPYEAAEILGLSKFRQFLAITLPYLWKPIISITFAVFTMVVTDYGVPLMIGGKYTTIPVLMYQEVIGQLNFGKGSVYGIILLVPAVIAFVFDLLKKEKGNSSFVTREIELKDNKIATIGSYIYCFIVSICIFIPIISFAVMGFANYYPNDLSFSLKNVFKALDMGAINFFGNSVLIALIASVVGMCFSFVTAYFTARTKSAFSKVLHLISIISVATPGIVLGLSYVLVFKTSFIYGTLIILVMVNIIHFISSPYLMVYNCLNKINHNLESVGETLGISKIRIVKDVIIPQCKLTLCEVFTYFFVNCMITISAVSFLATNMNKPIALMINEFEAQMRLECAAIVSLAILIVNILVKLIFSLIKRKIKK